VSLYSYSVDVVNGEHFEVELDTGYRDRIGAMVMFKGQLRCKDTV